MQVNAVHVGAEEVRQAVVRGREGVERAKGQVRNVFVDLLRDERDVEEELVVLAEEGRPVLFDAVRARRSIISTCAVKVRDRTSDSLVLILPDQVCEAGDGKEPQALVSARRANQFPELATPSSPVCSLNCTGAFHPARWRALSNPGMTILASMTYNARQTFGILPF